MIFIANEYLPRAVAEDVLDQNNRPLKEQMRSLRLCDGDFPTNGAVLAFGRDPRWWLPEAYVQYVRYGGDDRAAPIKNSKLVAGRLDDVLSSLRELLEINIETRIDPVSGPRERRFPDYPVEALREFAYNAVMHRSYEGTHTPVRIEWFSDNVRIDSPGGLFGAVTPESLEHGDGVTSYRNLLITEIMHNLGFAQRFGSGIPRARQALASNGNPEPEFHFDPARVVVTVRQAQQ